MHAPTFVVGVWGPIVRAATYDTRAGWELHSMILRSVSVDRVSPDVSSVRSARILEEVIMPAFPTSATSQFLLFHGNADDAGFYWWSMDGTNM